MNAFKTPISILTTWQLKIVDNVCEFSSVAVVISVHSINLCTKVKQ